MIGRSGEQFVICDWRLVMEKTNQKSQIANYKWTGPYDETQQHCDGR